MPQKNLVNDIKSLDETSKIIDVAPHILHLWIKKFPILVMKKGVSGDTGFDARDIAFLHGLKYMLLTEGKTTTAVQKILNERGVSYISAYGKDKIKLNPVMSKLQSHKQKLEAAFSSAFKKVSGDDAPPVQNNNDDSVHELSDVIKNTDAQIDKIFTDAASQDNVTIPQTETIPETIIEPKTLTITQAITSPSLPPVPSVPAATSVPSKSFDAFEDKWRNFMHNKGKIASAKDIRANRLNDDTIDDSEILFLDDDDDNIIVATIPQKNTIPYGEYHVISAPQDKRDNRQNKKAVPLLQESAMPSPNHISVHTQEKMQHILAKLDILKSEMIITRQVITDTLKAFGYSGFENAYNKHDNKSVY